MDQKPTDHKQATDTELNKALDLGDQPDERNRELRLKRIDEYEEESLCRGPVGAALVGASSSELAEISMSLANALKMELDKNPGSLEPFRENARQFSLLMRLHCAVASDQKLMAELEQRSKSSGQLQLGQQLRPKGIPLNPQHNRNAWST
jgi:hypothetical protein